MHYLPSSARPLKMLADQPEPQREGSQFRKFGGGIRTG